MLGRENVSRFAVRKFLAGLGHDDELLAARPEQLAHALLGDAIRRCRVEQVDAETQRVIEQLLNGLV